MSMIMLQEKGALEHIEHRYTHLGMDITRKATKRQVITPDRRQSKTPILSRNVDKKSIETVFSIAICSHTGDKRQSKTLFLSIFDPRSSIVDYVFDCPLPGVVIKRLFHAKLSRGLHV